MRTAVGTELHARHAVVCNGSDLRTLFPDRFTAAGFQRCKLQMLRTRAAAGVAPADDGSLGIDAAPLPGIFDLPQLGPPA